ncbi:MAG: isoprenylcysteine carboxylmethyltransferase family protein [Alphaproteobacteria bacterium]
MTNSEARSLLLKARRRHTWIVAVPLLLAFLVSGSSWSNVSLLHALYQWIGYFLTLICVLGRGWCSAYIGGRKNYELITAGPYSAVRNPLYVFSFIGVAGIGFCTGTVTYLVILTVLFAAYYQIVVWREEKFMAETFGQAFADYKARVPRWWHNFDLWQDVLEVQARPRFLYITLRDGAMFFLAFPLLRLIEYLHGLGALPVLLRLP